VINEGVCSNFFPNEFPSKSLYIRRTYEDYATFFSLYECSLKGQCHEIFGPRFFSSNNTPWAPDSRAKAFLNSDSNSPRYDRFKTQKSRMRCQWHRMHENFLLGSPFKFICFWNGGVEPIGNIQYMFLIDIPFKGCQGCSNRSLIVHAVPYFACGVNDTECIFKNSYIFANSNSYSKMLWPLNQGSRTDVLMKKTEGWKSRDTVPLIWKFWMFQNIFCRQFSMLNTSLENSTKGKHFALIITEFFMLVKILKTIKYRRLLPSHKGNYYCENLYSCFLRKHLFHTFYNLFQLVPWTALRLFLSKCK
jgi:hypothetical protein